ncbi:probable palmitoyltransferase ZDHHC24 [Drosophila takahashii]|uniref:probable palmitoyltransferase ZDHHC24 n=1 Tax=Drosophila takahashii TaxID=29030 RepID=UPI001CF84BCD|nr:probable palmitoyltransferase ZDHHC24 [Drosophila takahashii]
MEVPLESLRHRITMDSSEQQETVSVPGGCVVKDCKRWQDVVAVILNVLMTLFFYFFDVFYVMPQFLGIFGQTVHFLVSTWIVYNILGNLRACIGTMNSVYTLPPEMQQPAEGEEHLWHFCDLCQRSVPPRSWHCKTCKTCILKRDHHCNFVGNCVGHNNHRYFLWFSFYATIGSLLALADNTLLANKYDIGIMDIITINFIIYEEFMNPGTHDLGLHIGVRMLLGMNFVAIALPGCLAVTTLMTIRYNSVMYKTFDKTYDLGLWKNIAEVLGRRRLWTLLSPSIKSPLPHNGTQWQSKNSV